MGKYTGGNDAYLSVIKSLEHASVAVGRKLVIDWIEADYLVDKSLKAKLDSSWKTLKDADGVLVPGGFGIRGIEGKI